MTITAKRFAEIAHGDQMYGDEPYMSHLMTVAWQFTDGSVEQDVAWLHDVLEDTNVNCFRLYEVYGEVIGDAVVILTRTDEFGPVRYLDFIRGIKESNNPIAIAVKIADNKANLAASGKPHLEARYRKSIEILEGK